MINKIIYETADYVNFKYPGLIFTTELIFQENLNSITVSVKNLGKNPRQNLKNIFNSEAETLKSQANINKKSCSSILNLAKDLIEMSRLEVTMLSTNNKILKKERKFSKDLNSLTLDIKLLMEGMRSNYSIESKKLLDKILQKELLEINQKLKRLQSNYTELKECEIDSFFNVSEFIKSNRLEKYLDAFNYENSYQTLINFFEMSSINLNHAVLETQKLIGSTIDSDETVPLFFDVQNIILESQKFFLKNENNLIACIIFVYDKLAAAIQKYIEELKNVEKTCLELNQDILRIIYLNFIKKNVRSKGKALINENRYFINSMGILPLYENMDLQKSINLVTKTEKFIEMLTGSLKTVNDIKNHFLSQFFSMFFKKLYINTIEKFKLLKVQLRKNIFTVNHLEIIKMQEIKFIDSISDVDNFLRLYSNIAKKDHQQEEKQMSYQALFLKSNEYLTSLNGIFSKLENYSETQEFIELINPIQMKIRYYVDNLNLLSGKFMIFLQKGNDENDQSCLECLEEGEKLINASYIIINKSFDEKVMKAIGRSHVENEDIFKETKKALDLLFNLKNNHENICTEEYICSLVLKKKVENNLTKIKSLIINLKSLLLAISNCTFFNISHINKIMQINYSIISEKSNEIKKTEKLRKILDHIKEFEQFLNINRNYIMEKVNKLIKERVNIEVKFYNYFLFMDEMNMKIANIYQSFQINEFSIILFDNPFLEKIENLCHLLEDIDINSQQILNLHYEENVILEKIKENINTWKNNIQNMLYFDDKSIQVLRNKLKIIFSIKNEENSILREINGIFSACEKTPKKRKKDTMEKEILIEKFFNEVNAFAELISEAQVAKNYIFGYRQKGNINKIINLEELKELMSEIYDLNKILMIGLKYMKEINEEENEITLRENLRNGIDDGSLTENDVVDESNDVNLIKLRFKEYLKEKLEAFQIETSSDKTKSKDLSIKLKKFLQSSIYI